MSTSMFEQSHHSTIGKVEVSSKSRDADADALEKLLSNIAASALLNSRERSAAPKCHPETRVAVQQELFSFVADDNNDKSAGPKRMMWLTGPAGSGKTTIMNTVGERLKKKGNLAAAFFFSSFWNSHERGTKDRFVTTLAYQLIQDNSVPEIRGEVLTSIAKNPAIFRMSLKEQMEVLILQPLRLCQTRGDLNAPPQVILVDGLDECGQSTPEADPTYVIDAPRLSRELDQAEVLDVLLNASSEPTFPFRVVVASRPDPAIDEFFFASTESHSSTIFLDSKYNPNADITLFFNSHFARIRRKHCLSPSWPGEDTVSKLVENASEQMIYAVTVVRFMETPSKSPQSQLEIVLEGIPSFPEHQANPFGPLDALYSRILNLSPDPILALRWLKAYQYLDVERGFPTWCFNRLCESSEGEADRLFASTTALVASLNQKDKKLAEYRFYHKSFQEFLRYPSRYGNFFAESEEGGFKWLVTCFLRLFERKALVVRELPIPPRFRSGHTLGERLTREVLRLWYFLISERSSFTEFYDEQLLHCDAHWWTPRVDLRDQGGRAFTMLMFVVSHNQCRPFKPCRGVCKRWRKAILQEWKYTSRDSVFISLPGKLALLLDRFGLKRIPLRSSGFGVTVFHKDPAPGSIPNSHRYTWGTSSSDLNEQTSVDGNPPNSKSPSWVRKTILEPESSAGLTSLGELHSNMYRRRSSASSVMTHNSVATGYSRMFGTSL